MEKLQLKDIAPYLPYGLKWSLQKLKTFTMTGLTNETLYTNEGAVLTWTKHPELPQALFPILRPLSDLTKEIEVNGEKFVPIYVLFEMWCRNKKPEYQEYYIDDNPNTIYCSHPSTSETFALTKYDLMHNSAWVVNKLHEWHFDTNNLIEKGLAINKNTL